MTADRIGTDALDCLGELHKIGRDPVAELAYCRSVARRLREAREARNRLR